MIVILLIFILITLVLSYFFIKNPTLGAYLLIFSLPFERIPSYELSVFANITLRPSLIVAGAMFLAFCFGIIFKKHKVIFDKSILFLSLYLFVVALSITQAHNPSRAFLVLMFTIFVVAVYFLITNLIRQKSQLLKIEKVIFWSALIVCLFGIYQFIGDTFGLPDWLVGLKAIYTKKVFGFPRVQSVGLEPLYFASFLLTPFSLFTVLFLKKEGFSKRYFLIIFLTLFSIVLTLSRGGFAAILAILAVLFIFFFKEWITKKGFYIFLTMVLAIILAISSISISTYITNKSAKLGVENLSKQSINISSGESVEGRAKTRNFALNIFSKNSILGIGIGNFGPNIAGYPPFAPEGGWLIVNNEPLEVLAETGILGLLSLFVALGYIFIRGVIAFYKSSDLYIKTWLGGMLAVFLGMMAQYQTFSTLYIIHIWVMLGLIVVCTNLVLNKK